MVSWKQPPNESYYEPSWLIAENLDQNSLASAFRQFPMDADPDREQDNKLNSTEEDWAGHFELEDDFSDDEDEESDEEDMLDKSSDDMQEYEEEDNTGKATGVVKGPDVSHLEDSGMSCIGFASISLLLRILSVLTFNRVCLHTTFRL